jgi:membrane fusion protein (multidrug efflux system)
MKPMLVLKRMKNVIAAMGGIFILSAVFTACTNSAANSGMMAFPPQTLPVFQVHPTNASTTEEYTAALEGTKNIDIRPQVSGYLQQIYVDEGAFVHKGQPLFRIDAKVYQAQLDNAKANLLAAKANEENAQINVTKLQPLLQANVVSDVQMKSAQASLDAAKASVAQAEAMVQNAGINVGYTEVLAPVEGYLGKIPFKLGSLVGPTDAQALTVVSEVSDMYAYFSMSEQDFLAFKDRYKGATIEDKIKQMPPVLLVLSNGSVYPEKGRVETVEGQFDKNIGAIPFRVLFPNPNGLLRTGNTGKIRIPTQQSQVLVVPQEATFELQDKVFVFAVGDSNKVASKPISIAGTSGNYYLVKGGLNTGDKLVYTGLDRLRDGAVIVPQPMSLDSLITARPL